MNSRNTIRVNTSDAIALCHIKEKFKTFNERLITYLKTKTYKGELLSNLREISHGKKIFFARATKKFYQENKEVIDIINTHSDIISFIYNNYNLLEDDNIQFEKYSLYQYMLRNRDYTNLMKFVLTRIKDLGFETFEFDEYLEFQREEYQSKTNSLLIDKLEIFDNFEIIPCYETETIKYITNRPNYNITLFFKDGEIVQNCKRILLSSLTFDSKRLPEDISKNAILESLKKAIETKKIESSGIRTSVDLNLNTEELTTITDRINDIVDNIDEKYNKEEFKETLSKIQDQIVMLKILTKFYDKYLIGNNPSITEEILKNEKTLCKRKQR